MNTKNTKTNKNTNMKKSTPEVAKAADSKATAKPKLTAAYIKEMVAKGLSPLTGKPIRKYSRTGKRYAGKVETATVKAEAKPVTEKVEAKVVEAPVKTEATKPAIPVLKAKKGVKKAKKA